MGKRKIHYKKRSKRSIMGQIRSHDVKDVSGDASSDTDEDSFMSVDDHISLKTVSSSKEKKNFFIYIFVRFDLIGHYQGLIINHRKKFSSDVRLHRRLKKYLKTLFLRFSQEMIFG